MKVVICTISHEIIKYCCSKIIFEKNKKIACYAYSSILFLYYLILDKIISCCVDRGEAQHAAAGRAAPHFPRTLPALSRHSPSISGHVPRDLPAI